MNHLVTLATVGQTVSNEKEVVKTYSKQALPTYRALRAEGDSHWTAMETLNGEAQVAHFCRR